MEIQYDRQALEELIQDASAAVKKLWRARDQQSSAYESNVGKYNRMRAEAQDRLYRARINLSRAESAIAAADAAISNARQDEDGASAELQNAMQMRSDAMQEKVKAEAEVNKAQQVLGQLDSVWQSCGAPVRSAMMTLEDRMTVFSSLTGNCRQDLGEYMKHMENSRSVLYGGGEAAAGGSGSAKTGGARSAASSGGAAQQMPGWCARNSMKSVFADADGNKKFTITIGGESRVYPCTKAGAAKAYRAAVRSGDQNMIARTAAMYEVETIRESLELTGGEPGVPQLGGYHGDVRSQDPPGFESHHIPSNAVQAVTAARLPALSISHDDHTKTSSYSGKQNRPMRYDNVTYKEAMAQRIGLGGSGYIEAMRNELYDLRVAVGNRYDGGISGYLDAVMDMLATRGIPERTAPDDK